ncbi:MAG: FAD binding domain-containing protein [Pseudomonadota bacterium]
MTSESGHRYHRPERLDDALALLRECAAPLLVAGGQHVVPDVESACGSWEDVIDLSALDVLRGIHVEGESIVIGAGETHHAIGSNVDLRRRAPALADLAMQIGDPQVRERGTIGGSLAVNDPYGDYGAVLIALDAVVRTDSRQVNAEAWISSGVHPREIIVSVSFQRPSRAVYVKFRQPAAGYALVGLFLAETNQGVRAAIVGAADTPFRVARLEAVLNARLSASAVPKGLVSIDALVSDIHATAEYRAALIDVAAKRAVQKIEITRRIDI